ncbi:LamG domain-containing protein, partial [Candidatus Pacearchaeota archaeon]|nr:LamG domain-containing protein [Candidatus Pacearchaeota archaeon]
RVMFTCFFVFMVVFTFYTDAETIEGNTVYVDSAKVYLDQTPYLLRGEYDQASINFISKQFSGDIDIGFGFPSDEILPKNAYINNDGILTDITSSFNKINYDYGGVDKWYFTKSFNVNAGQNYNLVIDFKFVSPGSGKYWICGKPSSQSIAQAIAAGNFLCLDPLWDSKYMFRTPLYGNISDLTTPTSGLVPKNLTLNGSLELFWCDDLTINQTNETIGYLYWNNYTDYECYDATGLSGVTTNIDEGNGTNSGVTENDLLFWQHIKTLFGDSIYHYNLTVVGSPTGPVSDCKIGGCYQFDGVNEEYLSAGFQSDFDELTNLTACGWTKRDSIAGGNNCFIVGQFDRGDCDAGAGWSLYGSAGNIGSIMCVGGTSYTSQSTGGAIANVWQHYCVTYDGETMRTYVNGSEIATNSGPSGSITALAGDEKLTIGCSMDDRGAPDYNFMPCNGQIDEVKVWNRTLSADEINFTYNVENQFVVNDTAEENISRTASIFAVSYDVQSFSFASSDFIPGFQINFNNTKNGTYIYLSSLNLEKIVGGTSSDVSVRVLFDGSIIQTETIRTLSTLGDKGTASISPFIFFAASGEHNITVEFARTQTGSINVSNIDFVLANSLSSKIGEVGGDFNVSTYSFTSTGYLPAFNFTMNKTATGIFPRPITSKVFMLAKQTIQKTLGGNSVVSFFLNDLDTNISSNYWARLLSGSSDIGSSTGLYITPILTGIRNFTIQSQQTDVGSTVTTNITLFQADLTDNAGNVIANFEASNASTNLSNSIQLTSGIYPIAQGAVKIIDGDSYFIASTTSFESLSGSQMVRYFMNSTTVDESICFTEKENQLDSTNDIKNIVMYTTCENLTVGQNYNFTLWIDVESGETVQQLDETLNGFETQSFNITEGNLPPIPNIIINPQDGDQVLGLGNVTWLAFSDPNNGGGITYNVSLYNLDGTFNITINDGISGLSTSVNWELYTISNYTLVVEGCDITSLCANTSIGIQKIELVIPIPESIRFCNLGTSMYNRVVDIETNILTGEQNITSDEDIFTCPNGCDNFTISNWGNAGCLENEYMLSILAIIFAIIAVIIVRGVFK